VVRIGERTCGGGVRRDAAHRRKEAGQTDMVVAVPAGTPEISPAEIGSEQEAMVQEAAESCPVNAIEITE